MKKNITILCSAALLIFAVIMWIPRPSSDDIHDTQKHSNHPRGQSSPPPVSNIRPALEKQSHIVRPPGLLSVSDGAINDMKNAAERTAALLSNVPNDQTGRRSHWFEKLKSWQKLLERAAQTGTREDLFSLVPIAASFFVRDRETDPLAEPLDDLRNWMEHPGPHIIREIAKELSENGGNLSASTGSLAVQVFSVRGFDNEPDWEDERKPIDSAGILISRPEIMQSLESLPVEQLSFFLRAQSPESFFRRYEQSGDGMTVLRQRYSENREALHGGFNSLASKVAAYQASTQAK